MTVDLHLGIPAASVEAVATEARHLPEVLEVFTDGDSWETWGERPMGDEPARHMVLRLSDADDADFLIPMHSAYLLPMVGARQEGIVASLTPSDEWSAWAINWRQSAPLRDVRATR